MCTSELESLPPATVATDGFDRVEQRGKARFLINCADQELDSLGGGIN